MDARFSPQSPRVSSPRPGRTPEVFDLSHILRGRDMTTCLFALWYLYGGPQRPEIVAFSHVLDDLRNLGGPNFSRDRFISVHNQLIEGITMTRHDAERISEIIKIDVDDFSIIQRKMQCALSALYLCRHIVLPQEVEAALAVVHGNAGAHVDFERRMTVAMSEYVGFLSGSERTVAESEFHEAVDRVLIARLDAAAQWVAPTGQPSPQAWQGTSVTTTTTMPVAASFFASPLSPVGTPFHAFMQQGLQPMSVPLVQPVTVGLQPATRVDVHFAASIASAPMQMPMSPRASINAMPMQSPATPRVSHVRQPSSFMSGAQELLVRFGVSLEEQRAEPRWAAVGAKLEAFYAHSPAATGSRKALLAQHAGGLRTAAKETYSVLPAPDGWREAVQREGRGGFRDVLRKVFGWTRSAFAEEFIRWQGRSSALWHRVPLLRTDDARVIDADVLSVSPPNLQGAGNTEWAAFVDGKGKLKADPFRAALAQKNAEILACVSQREPRRIVLSAFGAGAELAGLSNKEAQHAEKIARDNMIALAQALNRSGQVVRFAAGDGGDRFWKSINKKLGKDQSVPWAGSANPADWMESGYLLVNNVATGQFAGQPVGNGVDAALGQCSLLLDAHVFDAACWEAFGK